MYFWIKYNWENNGHILKFDNATQSFWALFSWTRTVGQFCWAAPHPNPFLCMLPVSCAKVLISLIKKAGSRKESNECLPILTQWWCGVSTGDLKVNKKNRLQQIGHSALWKPRPFKQTLVWLWDEFKGWWRCVSSCLLTVTACDCGRKQTCWLRWLCMHVHPSEACGISMPAVNLSTQCGALHCNTHTKSAKYLT